VAAADAVTDWLGKLIPNACTAVPAVTLPLAVMPKLESTVAEVPPANVTEPLDSPMLEFAVAWEFIAKLNEPSAFVPIEAE
jgi:hypothetical protein